jgi:hypothetical protein
LEAIQITFSPEWRPKLTLKVSGNGGHLRPIEVEARADIKSLWKMGAI